MTVTPLDYTRWRASELGVITEALEREAVLDLAGPLAGLDLLDVGCGDGTYAITAVKAGARVSAVDASAEAIDAAGRRASGAGLVLDLRVGDASRLPYPDATFDLVLAVTVLCFIPDTAGAVREMARVLRPAQANQPPSAAHGFAGTARRRRSRVPPTRLTPPKNLVPRSLQAQWPGGNPSSGRSASGDDPARLLQAPARSQDLPPGPTPANTWPWLRGVSAFRGQDRMDPPARVPNHGTRVTDLVSCPEA